MIALDDVDLILLRTARANPEGRTFTVVQTQGAKAACKLHKAGALQYRGIPTWSPTKNDREYRITKFGASLLALHEIDDRQHEDARGA